MNGFDEGKENCRCEPGLISTGPRKKPITTQTPTTMSKALRCSAPRSLRFGFFGTSVKSKDLSLRRPGRTP